jgi:hypothetical protein
LGQLQKIKKQQVTRVTLPQLIGECLEKLGKSVGQIPQLRTSKTLYLLRHREISLAHIWMDKQSFVVLRKQMTFCVNMGGASIHLQKYFIDKLVCI